jgi:hypothetical protein
MSPSHIKNEINTGSAVNIRKENSETHYFFSFSVFGDLYDTFCIINEYQIVFYIVSKLYTHVQTKKNKKMQFWKKTFFLFIFFSINIIFSPWRKNTFLKTRCILLLLFKLRFEWRITIGEKFQNEGGDRFTRVVTHCVEYLLLSKFFKTEISFFCGSKSYDYTQFFMRNPNISNSKNYSERKGAKIQIFFGWWFFFVFLIPLLFWKFFPKNLIEFEKKGDIRNQHSEEYLNM